MQNSMKLYPYDRRMRKMRTIPLRSAVLFGTGVMTMVHLVILFPNILYAAAIAMLLGGCALFLGQKKFRLDKDTVTYLSWYGALYVLILISVLYTVNTINPDNIIKRCGAIFILGFITAVLLKQEQDFMTLANGLIAGTLIVIGICIVHEGTQIGMGRIGRSTVGSAVALSNIVLVGFICAVWKFIFKQKGRVLNGLLSAGMLAIIVLTGSRRSLIISMMAAILLVLFNRKIKKSKRFIFIFILLLLTCIFVYLLFTNQILYGLIGWRIESMLSTMFGIGSTVEDASMAERSKMKEYAYEMFLERPLFGYGVHSFAYKCYGLYGKLVTSHCGYTELLACYGIVGFIIFYRVFVLYVRRSRRVFKTGTDVQILMVIFTALTLMCEIYTVAFITPQVSIMLTAGLNLLRKNNAVKKC